MADQMAKELVRAYVPICALDFRRVRSRGFIDNAASDVPRNLTHMTQSGGKVYMVQGGRIWVGNIATMVFDNFIEVDFTVYAMEQLADGIVVMSDKGFYFINESGRMSKIVTEALRSFVVRKSCSGGNMVFAVNTADEVVACAMVHNAGSAPFPAIKKISVPIDTVVWGADPSMVFCDGTLWVSREHDIYGFRNGGWTRKYDFPNNTIRLLGQFEDKLVIFFYDSPLRIAPIIDVEFDTIEAGAK